jgi:site-specific DNA-methyltransferase (adenine-specific)
MAKRKTEITFQGKKLPIDEVVFNRHHFTNDEKKKFKDVLKKKMAKNKNLNKAKEIELNTIIKGDVIEVLKSIPSESFDMIFADPPYFMQTDGVLLRTEGTPFKGVDDEWDKFSSYKEYDEFCFQWLSECRRVLRKDGTIFVIGAFQNIYRIGYIMQNIGFWILNDIVWNKTNPAPNFKGTRFTNANETILWCSKSNNSKYTFNYKTMKELNGGKQMKSVWNISLCTGNERIKDDNGDKAHNTQKPEQLLYNIILASTKLNDIILDPFMGSGTTGAVAKRLGRFFLGIDREEKYINIANERIENVQPDINDFTTNIFDNKPPRVSVKELIDKNYLFTDEFLYDKNKEHKAKLNEDGTLIYNLEIGSIHKISAGILNLTNNNGWDYWFVEREEKKTSHEVIELFDFKGSLISIDELRNIYREKELKWTN